MAKKGVNLLDEDGEEREPDEEGGEAARPPRRSGGGGGLIRYIIIGVAAVALLGGGGWAGYTFWWIPSKKREADRLEAQKKLEDLRKQRLAQLRAEAEQRKQALAILEQVQAEQQGKAAPKPGEAGKEGEKPPAAAASVPPAGAKPAAPPQAGAPKAEAPKKETAKPEPPAAPKPPAAPPQQMAQAKPPAMPADGKPAREVAPPQAAAKPAPEKPAPRMAQAPPQNGGAKAGPPAAPRPSPSRERQARRAEPSGPRAYSIQVATCRTDRCVQSFVSRLREKGLEARVSGGGGGAGGPMNEVFLGSFASRDEAENLAGKAQGKNLRTTIYESGGRWRVAAGSFRDLEDAAQMLDRAEDAGFRGELARRPGAPRAGSGLRAVRTGSFATRQEALAARARVVGAGFQGVFVVAEPRR